jgi:hypothetical protein
MTLNLFDVLRLLSGADYLRAVETERLQALARLSLRASFDEYYFGLLFYGMGSAVWSYLWFKSNYIPRALATFGVIAFVWAAACSRAFMIFPNYSRSLTCGGSIQQWVFSKSRQAFGSCLRA